ncbi:MAG: class I SAM-dependent methyltransferase [Gallionella sp.]|nr:class I SAM-dependent methyltransferase [Gallionella sp.]
MEIFLREFAAKWNYFWRKTRHRIVGKCAESVFTNMEIIAAFETAKDTLRFERKYLRAVPEFKTREKLFTHCFKTALPNGLCLEFGTYRGDSINILAKLQSQRHFFGFDSFIGLPETWTTGSRKGAFNTNGRPPKVRENVSLIKGFFDQTLPIFVKEHEGEKIALIHNDSDLYNSTITLFEELKHMIVPGTIVVFDEYYNYSEWLEGEYKAFMEITEKYQIKFEYIGYIRMGSQVAVRIL